MSGWSVPTPAAPAAAPVAAPTLQVEGLSVRFGGHLAVSDVSLAVRPGRISGLIGPNGAGKTTTFNAICGVTTPTAGRVLLEGDDVSRLSTHQRARRGIGRTFQRLEVFSSLTVADNVRVGQEIRAGWARRRRPAPQFLAAPGRYTARRKVTPKVGAPVVRNTAITLLPDPEQRLSVGTLATLNDFRVDVAALHRRVTTTQAQTDSAARQLSALG